MNREELLNFFNISAFEASELSLEKLINYGNLILDWNQKINLISRKDESYLFENHIAPSLSYAVLNIFQKTDHRIVDIGSGGGFPGIVNAIMFPEIIFTLIDATQKKVNVLNDVIEKLELSNANAIWGRVENIAFMKEHRAQYDVCTSRGLTGMGKLIPWSLPFLNKVGVILALKGGDLTDEIAQIKKRSRYEITEYEFDERYHYIERFKTLKIVEVERQQKEPKP